MKKRADVLLYEKSYVDSREKAKRLIMSGEVFVGTQRVEKAGEFYEENTKFIIKSNSNKYVSRGGFKLEGAILEYNISLKDNTCMDIGASTGGFTHCMLLNGAKKVYAVDVGYNQLDYSLRVDERVVSMERTNIRYFEGELIEDEIDFISIDVSFISLTLVLPVAYKILKENGRLVALIKPQFEAGREKVGKKGIVRDKETHREVIKKVLEFSKELGFRIMGLMISPIKGTTGNVEFLVYLEKSEYINKEVDINMVVGD